MLESSLEDYFRMAVLRTGRGRADKTVDLTRIGAPDREVQWHGMGLDKVELKQLGKKPEPHQTRYHQYLATCCVPVYLIDSKEKVDLYIAARSAGKHYPPLFSVPCDFIK